MRMLPALRCDAITSESTRRKAAGFGAATGDAAYETVCSDEDVEGDAAATAAIAAAVAAASGAGAAEHATVEGTGAHNCPLEHRSLQCARARAPQPAQPCTCRLGSILARILRLDRAVCTAICARMHASICDRARSKTNVTII